MSNPLCKYKDIFGKPNEGIHKYRMAGIAIFDTIFVIIVGVIISYFTKYSIWIVLLVLFISGIVLHRAFCVRTRIDRFLFPNI